jgi:hypothetical protein
MEVEQTGPCRRLFNPYQCAGEYSHGNVEGHQGRIKRKVRQSLAPHPPGTLRIFIRPEVPMQILYPFHSSIQQYNEQYADHHARPRSSALCGAKRPLRAHGFYWRRVTDQGFNGRIRGRRYRCLACRRTILLLPEFVMPYVRFAITFIAAFLKARLLERKILKQSAAATGDSRMPY